MCYISLPQWVCGKKDGVHGEGLSARRDRQREVRILPQDDVSDGGSVVEHEGLQDLDVLRRERPSERVQAHRGPMVGFRQAHRPLRFLDMGEEVPLLRCELSAFLVSQHHDHLRLVLLLGRRREFRRAPCPARCDGGLLGGHRGAEQYPGTGLSRRDRNLDRRH